jgi:hypothetical protein
MPPHAANGRGRRRGEVVREYSIPALADIPATCNLADMVTRRAGEQPEAVALRRKGAGGHWEDVTTS